ncbi:MAG: cation-translocating P-type ATPase [Candidatus Methylomirabilia bacterium]
MAVDASLHRLAAADVYAAADSAPQGLSSAEAAKRLAISGPNAIRTIRGIPLWKKFLANFTHLMALLLWAGGAMAFVGGMPQLGWAIWGVVVINAIFSFWQEFRAERATEALRRILPRTARVVRDGSEAKIPAEDLVPGDVILLSEGDSISADARLVEASELRVNLSTLTGESVPAPRTSEASEHADLPPTERPNLVFAGTAVASGTGRAVVFATGMGTAFGSIALLTQSVAVELSPLQKEVNRLTKVVTILAVTIGVVFFVISVGLAGRPLAVGFIFAVGMVVAFVPEGLLPTVTLALAMGVQRMARRNALIKKLSAVETLGACTVICTDKTGTLTQNEMTVREAWTAGRRWSADGVGYDPAGKFSPADGAPADGGGEPAADLRELLAGAALCNNARLQPPDGGRGWSILGDPTEAALLVAAAKGGLDEAALARDLPRTREIPFDSRRKRMSTVHTRGGGEVAYVKGAPREVLELCTTLLIDGKAAALDGETRSRILAVNDEYARGALRVLAVARRELPPRPELTTAEWVERELTFLGLVAMMDPPRPEVAAAVVTCRKAGIRITMVTGDYGLTAESIARRVGIVGEGARIVTGQDLDAMTDEGLAEVLRGEAVFARVAPEHKLRVVTALQTLGEVVAVTGDGVNDAPALRKADIGIAMGIAGTDVAKEAAPMILLDDNFASIVSAIEEGRAVYANIRKFTTYIFTSNTPEAWPFILQILFNVPLALPVMQILAVDLGTDILPALALGTEKPEPGLMDRPPRSPRERLVNRALVLRSLLWLGSIQTFLCFAGFFFFYWTMGYTDLLHLPRPDLFPYGERLLSKDGRVYVMATSMFHAGVVATQIGNAYACRTERSSVWSVGFWSNRLLLAGFAAELALIAALIYLPPLRRLFEEGPLPPKYWLFLMLYPPVMFLAEEGRKAFMRRRERRAAVNAGGGKV